MNFFLILLLATEMDLTCTLNVLNVISSVFVTFYEFTLSVLDYKYLFKIQATTIIM